MVLVSAYVMKKQYTRACLGFTPYFVVDLIFCAIEILVILFFFTCFVDTVEFSFIMLMVFV